MDIQKEIEAFQECYKTSRDYKFYVRHEMSEKQIFEFKKGKYVVDCVNNGWKIWQAAKAKSVTECVWAERYDGSVFESSCGHTFELSNDGTLDDNNMKHCCFCGGKIDAQEQSYD